MTTLGSCQKLKNHCSSILFWFLQLVEIKQNHVLSSILPQKRPILFGLVFFVRLGIWRVDSKGRSKQTVRWTVCPAVASPQRSESVPPTNTCGLNDCNPKLSLVFHECKTSTWGVRTTVKPIRGLVSLMIQWCQPYGVYLRQYVPPRVLYQRWKKCPVLSWL